MLNVVMLNVVMLNVVMLNVVILNVVMLNFVMLEPISSRVKRTSLLHQSVAYDQNSFVASNP
jgi:hypothetical protein